MTTPRQGNALTPGQAAAKLGICKETIYRMIRDGRLNGAVADLGTPLKPLYRLNRAKIEALSKQEFRA